jgi:signal peptidase complex subunit 2
MAKKKNKQVTETPVVEATVVADTEEEEEEETSDEVMELLQVDVGDVIKLKQILDETVAHAVLDVIPLEEDLKWDNIKLSLMAIACVFAMVAQFAPIPFPESRPLLGACCCLYFILSGILQLLTTFYDRDCICMTHPVSTAGNPKDGTTCKNKEVHQVGLRVRTCLPRFSEFYTVTLEFKGQPNSHKQVSQEWSVGQFFDVEGMFDELALTAEIESLWQRMKNGKYDTMASKKNK